MSEPLISATDLRRTFAVTTRAGRLRRKRSEVVAVDDISFEVSAGESIGYIGPNGAGKSTTIKMLTGLLTPTSGDVRVLGLRPVPDRRRLSADLGVVFGQRSQLWWDLPLTESFDLLAAIHRLEASAYRRRREQIIDLLDMGSFLGTPVRQLSLGQRMRGEVTAALLHSPRIVVLDEPTIGLDLVSKESLRRFLAELNTQDGVTLLLTTHDLSDIERLSRRILVIDHGALLYDGTLDVLVERFSPDRRLVVDLSQPMAADRAIPAYAGVSAIEADDSGLRWTLTFDRRTTSAPALIGAVMAEVEVRDLRIEEPAIEDVVRRLYASR